MQLLTVTCMLATAVAWLPPTRHVQPRRHALLRAADDDAAGDDFGKGGHMGLMGMHPAFGQKTGNVANALGIGKFCDDFFDGVGFGDGAGFDGLVNFGQFLHDDTTSTEVHVTDFRIAHLTFGQADRAPRTGQPRSWTGVVQSSERRNGRELHRVTLVRFAFEIRVTPAVENGENHRSD